MHKEIANYEAARKIALNHMLLQSVEDTVDLEGLDIAVAEFGDNDI